MMANESYESCTAPDAHWMRGYLDVMRDVRSDMREKRFNSAKKRFCDFLEKSQRAATGPEQRPTIEHSTPLGDILNIRTAAMLESAGYMTVGAVAAAADDELLAIRNFGRTALAEVRRIAVPEKKRETVHGYFAQSDTK